MASRVHVLREHGLRVLALTPALGATPIQEMSASDRTAVLIGAEGPGLSDEALRAADARVRIPMRDGADSLNVTVAASIALYALRGNYAD